MAELRKRKYLIAFALTTLIFLIGIWVGNYIAKSYAGDISDTQDELRIYSLGMSLQNELLGGKICEIDVFEATSEKVKLGRMLETLEKQTNNKNQDLLRLTNMYSLLSLQQYLLVKRQREMCNCSVNPILFFYDNIKNDEESKKQGFVLDYIYEQYPKDVVIYSFNVNVHNPAVDTLIEMNKISDAPDIIINGVKYTDMLNSEDLEKILKLSSTGNQTCTIPEIKSQQ